MDIYELNWTQEFKDPWGASPQSDQLNNPLLLSSVYLGQTFSSRRSLSFKIRWYTVTRMFYFFFFPCSLFPIPNEHWTYTSSVH